MVRAGKFDPNGQGLSFANNLRNPPYGMDDPNKLFFVGTVTTKRTRFATAQNVRLSGATWGFDWIDYAVFWRVKPGTGKVVGAGFGAGVGTMVAWYNHNPTLWVPATGAIATIGQQIAAFVFGRSARG